MDKVGSDEPLTVLELAVHRILYKHHVACNR